MLEAEGIHSPRWAPQGDSLYYLAGREPLKQLWKAPVSAGTGWKAGAPKPSLLAKKLTSDRLKLCSRLITEVSRPEIQEALVVASTDLTKRIDLWKAEPDSKRGRRVERSLVCYFCENRFR